MWVQIIKLKVCHIIIHLLILSGFDLCKCAPPMDEIWKSCAAAAAGQSLFLQSDNAAQRREI